MKLLGIDPGLTGAMAIIDGDTLVKVHDMPVQGGEIEGRQLYEMLFLLQSMDPVERCYIEQLQPMPKNGSQSNYTNGLSFGICVTVLKIVGLSFERVRPSVWKSQSGLTGKDKHASLALARELWPEQLDNLHLVKHHNRAEAALIARWGYYRRIREGLQK